MAAASFVQVNVGGFPYSIALSDIEKFPGSFFACMIKKEWTDGAAETISIQRDGTLFKFVYAYIVNGHLPRDKEGLIDLNDATLDGLKEEADFYGLEALSKECSLQHRRGTDLDLPSYMTIRKYVAHLLRYGGNFQIDISSRLARKLKCVWSPFLVRGSLGSYSNLMLHKSSTMHKLNLAELIAAATVSPFGRGTETVVDTTFRNSFEVDASRLNLAVLQMISNPIAANTAEEEEAEEEDEEENNDEDEEVQSDNEHFWRYQPKGRENYRPKSTLPSREHLIEADTALIFEALDEDLQSFGTIILCLQHLYPECQTNPAFLKGGDRVLYDILTSGSSALAKYDVQVVAATICRQHDYDDNGCG
eukprot:gene20422-23196_t